MARRLVLASLSAPRATLVFWVVTILIASVGVPRTTAEVGYRILLGETHPAIVRIDEFIQRYGGGLPVILAWSCGPSAPCRSSLDPTSLAMARDIEVALLAEPSVREVISPASMPLVIADDGDVSIRRLVHDGLIVADHVALSRKALDDPAWVGTVINGDGTVGAIVMQTASAESAAMQELVQALFAAIKPFQDLGFEFHPVGDPIDFVVAGGEMKAETPRIIPILVTLLAIIAYLLLRSVTAVALSLAVSGSALITALGLMGWLGWPEVEWSQALPPFILVAGFCNSVHLLSRVSSKAHERTSDRLEVDEVVDAAAHVGPGCILASLTTALAVLSFVLSGFESFSQFGVIAALGVLSSLACTFSAVPVLLMRIPRFALASETSGLRWSAFLEELVSIASRRRWVILAGSTAMLCLSIVGLSMLSIDIDERALLGRDSKVVLWANWVEENLRKADGLEVEFVLPESERIASPKNLGILDDLVSSLAAHPRLDDGWSIVDLLKSANRALHDDDASFYEIGSTTEENAALLMLLSMGSARAVDAWVTIDQERVRASFSADPMSMNVRSVVLADVRSAIDERLPNGWSYSLTGPLEVYSVFVHEIQRTQLSSFLTAASAIGLVLCGYFWMSGSRLLWSIRWSIAALVVSAFPVALTLGTMGFLGIPLDAGTAMVGAIVLGVAVDDSVHLIVHYRRHRVLGLNAQGSIGAAIRGSGRALVTTSAALSVGFFSLLMSSWSSIASFGLLSGVAVICALIADLIILPALIVAISGADSPRPSPQRDPMPRDSERILMLSVMVLATAFGFLAPYHSGGGWSRGGSGLCDVFPGDRISDYSGFAERCRLNLPSLSSALAATGRLETSVGNNDEGARHWLGLDAARAAPMRRTSILDAAVGVHGVGVWLVAGAAAFILILGASVVRYSIAGAAIPFGLLSAMTAVCGFFRVLGGTEEHHPAPEFLAYAMLWAPLVHLSLAYPTQHRMLRRVPIVPVVIYSTSVIVVVPAMIGYWRIPELFLASRVIASALILLGLSMLCGAMLRTPTRMESTGHVVSGRRCLLAVASVAVLTVLLGASGTVSGTVSLGLLFVAMPIPIGASLLLRTGHDNEVILAYGFVKGLASIGIAVLGIVAVTSMTGGAKEATSLMTLGVAILFLFLLHDSLRQVARRWLLPLLERPEWSPQVIGAEFAARVRELSTGEDVCFELVDQIHRYLRSGGVMVVGESGSVLASMGRRPVRISIRDSEWARGSGQASAFARTRVSTRVAGPSELETAEIVVSIDTRREGRVTLMVLPRLDRSPFSAAERTLVAAMLDVAAVAIDRAGLAEQIRRDERYDTIGRVGAGLMHDIGRRATSITQRARGLTAADGLTQRDRVEAVRIEAMADEIADCVQRLARFPEAEGSALGDPLPLVELVDAAVCSTRHMHPRARIRVDADMGSTRVLCPDDLRLALINVLDNAVRACEASAEVHVLVRSPGVEACIEVRDRGCGMSREQLARAFDPFFTTRPDGTGLGLASVLATLRRLGGSVTLESEVGQGTQVRLTWLAASEAALAS